MLRIAHVSKSFYGLPAVQDVSLEAPPGRISAVIGPNGAGKTTLFNCLTGLVPPDRSESCLIARDGRQVTLAGRPPEEICRLGIARTFQQVRLFDSLSAVDNVAVATLVHEPIGVMPALVDRLLRGGRVHRTRRQEALDLLDRVGLAAHATEFAGELDHGNRRRLEIARALATRPAVLLLDEPAAGMNRAETERLMVFLSALRGEGLAVLLIEHDMHLVMGVSDRVYVMDHGELVAEGTPDEVTRNPAVIEAYLGSATGLDAPA